MNQKKLIIFGCSFTPFLIVIIGTIIYSSSSKNNVHQNQQNNLQLAEEKEVVVMKNQEEEYIPCLDNYKIQIGLWLIYPLIGLFCLEQKQAKDFYNDNDLTEKISKNVSLDEGLFVWLLIVPLCFLAGEFFASFIVYLPACLINKKPCKKAFSIYHRFWCQSWTNALLSFLIIELFGFIDIVLWPVLNYIVGFLGSFFENSKQDDQKNKEQNGQKNYKEEDVE